MKEVVFRGSFVWEEDEGFGGWRGFRRDWPVDGVENAIGPSLKEVDGITASGGCGRVRAAVIGWWFQFVGYILLSIYIGGILVVCVWYFVSILLV